MLKTGIVSVIGVLAMVGGVPGCNSQQSTMMTTVDPSMFPPESTATLWVKGVSCPG